MFHVSLEALPLPALAIAHLSHLLPVCVVSSRVSVPHTLSKYTQSVFFVSESGLQLSYATNLQNPELLTFRLFLSDNINSTRKVSGFSNHDTLLIGIKEAHLG